MIIAEKSVQVGIRVTPEFKAEIKAEAKRRGLSIQRLVERAVEYYSAVVPMSRGQIGGPNVGT